MSSWTFETYEKENIFGEYRWNKGDGYEVIFGHIYTKGEVVVDIFTKTYATVEQARRAFQRQVKKIEKGE